MGKRRVMIQIILDTDYVVVERNWYGFFAVFVKKRL